MLAAKFPVPMVVGPHPFPFRTRQLSPLTPMVLQPQGCWESRKAPDYSKEPVASNRGRLFTFVISIVSRGPIVRCAARLSRHRLSPKYNVCP